MPDRQLIEEADHKTLRCIELAYRFFGATIIRILADPAVGSGETGNGRSRGVGIGKVLRNGIRHEQAQPLRKALVHLQLHGVISGVAGAIRGERVIFLVKVAVLRKRTKDLVDVPVEARVRQLDTGSNGIRTASVRKAASILRQVAAKCAEEDRKSVV